MSLSEQLIVAAKNGNTKEVRKLLAKGAPFTKDQFGNTALHEAAWNGNGDIVKILLPNAFCLVDSVNNTGFTALHLASQNGHAKIVKTLLKSKANPSLLNQHGETALHLAAKYDHGSVFSSFAAQKVPLDLRGKDENTALHIASKLGNIDSVKAMLSSGAHPAIPNGKSMRPIDYADHGGYSSVVKLLNTAMLKLKPKKNRSTPPVVSVKSTPNFSSIPSPSHSLSQLEEVSYGISHSQLGTVGLPKLNPRQNHSALVLGSDPLSPSSPIHSLSQPEEVSYGINRSHLGTVGLPAGRPNMQRAMTVSTSIHPRPSRDVGGSVSTNKMKHSEQRDPRTKTIGSYSPNPHRYFCSQDDLSRGMCGDQPFTSLTGETLGDQPTTIDQLLSEIERETHGPGYTYSPPRDDPCSDLSLKGSPKTRGHPLVISTNRFEPTPSAKSLLMSTQQGISSKENYDMLEGQDSLENNSRQHCSNFNSTSNNSPSQASRARVSIEHAQVEVLTAQQILETRCTSQELAKIDHSRVPPPLTNHSLVTPPQNGRFKNHKYETLLPLETDIDSYVYMAPLSDYPDLLQKEQTAIQAMNLSRQQTPQSTNEQSSPDEWSSSEFSFTSGGSKGGKRAAVCEYPVEPDTTHQPSLVLDPIKSILSQSNGTEVEKSQLENYLQNELETIRQTFQIRLNQIEKRYQKQLELEKQKKYTTGVKLAQDNSEAQHFDLQERQSSWHSYLSADQGLDGFDKSESRSGSALDGNESDGSEVDSGLSMVKTDTRIQPGQVLNKYEPSPVNESSTSHALHSTAAAQSTDGLKGEANWSHDMGKNMEDKDPYDFDYEDMSGGIGYSIEHDTHLLVQQKVRENHEAMLKHLREKSEAQIVAIEQQYQHQICEVQRVGDGATEKVIELQSHSQHLENRFDTQTLV